MNSPQQHGEASEGSLHAYTRNRYVDIDDGELTIDVFNHGNQELGKGYYSKVFRYIEEDTDISGLTFFVAYHTPDRLPEYGNNVVLLILSDEAYQHRVYFSQIRCVLSCLGAAPVYLDGLPLTRLRLIALTHYIYKRGQRIASLWREFRKSKTLRLREARRRTFHVPLGLYAEFRPKVLGPADRTIEYAFLGSVGFDERFRKWIHRLLSSPKVLARHIMLDNLRVLSGRLPGKIVTTTDFWESVNKQDAYCKTLEKTCISICPRGTTYETYRFFESCRAGCAIICEPLPRVWFYDNHPGIVVTDWSTLPSVVEGLVADRGALAARMAAALAYWHTTICERAVAGRIARFIKTVPPLP